MGAHVPFWPLWLEAWGLSAAEVGLFPSLGMAVRVGAGMLIPALADRLDARRGAVVVCAVAGAVLFLGHLLITTRAALLAATLGVGAALAGIGPVGEALGVAAARHHGFRFAPARGAGSVGFLATSLVMGVLIARAGVDAALWWIVACLLAVAALALGHPGGRKVDGQVPPSFREIGRLLVNPVFVIFMAAAALTQASHAVFYALGTVHWRNLGLGEGEIGALWAASVAAEIVFLFAAGAAVTRRLGPVRAIAVSGAAAVVRWGAMMLDPTGSVLWPLQCLHLLTFALGYLGTIAFIVEAVPARFGGAAQGAASAMAAGLALALGMLLAAALYPALGGRTYGIGVAFALLGLLGCLGLARRWRGGELAL
jgi:PPP family 3-phenylpropionic acid transporter